MRSRLPTPRCLRHLLSAGLAAALLVASCLNPHPDDLPQANDDSPSPNGRVTPQTPVDVAETAPAGNAATAAPPVLDLGQEPTTLVPPAASAPGAPGSVPIDADADAGTPDAGPPDAALVAQ